MVFSGGQTSGSLDPTVTGVTAETCIGPAFRDAEDTLYSPEGLWNQDPSLRPFKLLL